MQNKNISCQNCKSKNIIKKGIRKTKIGEIQKYYCRSCNKYFAETNQNYKQYPIKIILKAISNYNLGYTLEKVATILESRYKLNIPISTISSWTNEYKHQLPYSKIRNKAKKLYNPKNIIFSKRLQHQQIYNFQIHKAKLYLLFHNILYNNQFTNTKKFRRNFLCPRNCKAISKDISKFYEPIKNYLEKIPTSKFPHHIFKQQQQSPDAEIAQFNNIKSNNQKTKLEQRASQLKFQHLKVTKLSKNNLANKLANLALNLTKSNKERHKAIQNFFLINDSTTIATEIPVYLTKDDIKYFKSKGFTFNFENYKTPITGHIDLLQIRNSLIHILDYKPDASKINPVEQLTIYALALASRTKLALKDSKAAWFDENNYYEFFPLHAVSPRRYNKE